MLTKLFDHKRLIASAVLAAFALYNTSLAVYATEINQNGVPYTTATTINQNGNIFNISTTTTNPAGNVGVNTFGKFNVSYGDIVNMNLINDQSKLVNLIFDSSASQINGIVNSYMNGQIGGNVLFANPHGFVVGEHGVFNVGSLTLMTPKEDVMKKIFDGTNVNNTNLDKLITFKFGNNNYYVGTKDDGSAKLEMVPAEITINGKINSAGGIDIINGGRAINIGQNAELNANMQFNDDTTGENVTASAGTAPSTAGTFATAMNGGKGINIVSQNRSDDNNYMSAIVNIEGKVHANGGDIIAQTEIHGMDSSEPDITDETTSASLINVKNGADIDGHVVTLRALSSATHGDHDLIGAKSSSWLAKIGVPLECLIDNFVHLGKMKTKTTVENGANISASSQTNIFAKTDMSKFSAMTISPIFAFDLVLLDVLTEAIVKSGASIDSTHLNVQSITDANISVSTTSTSILDMISDNVLHKGTFGEWGSYAITVLDADINNKAIIENGANLDVENNLNVLASMVRDVTVTTKNGFPLVDKNKGAMGLAVGVENVESENIAIMNANADLAGGLTVNADYAGRLTQSTSGNSGSPGEDGAFGMGGKIVKNIIKGVSGGFFFKYGEKIDKGFDHVGGNSANRANATFGKIHIAGAVSVANDEVNNHSSIGDAEHGIKPTISAGNVLVASTLNDNKSHVVANAMSTNGITAVAGAVAVNIKDLDSDAKAYGNFTINGDPSGSSPYGLIVRSNTKVERPSMLDSLWNFLDFLGIKNYEKTQKKSVDEVNSTNVDDYLANFNLSSDMQEKIDQNTSIMSLLKVFDYLTPELGAEGFFQTYAESSATAAAREGKTSGWAGAFGVTVSSTSSNAELVGGSTVTLNGHNATENGVLVAANTDSTMWVGTSLMSIFNIAKIKNGGFAPGTSARDGDATGGSISLLINSADTTASIGENALITTTSPEKAGDLEVKASENGQFINLAAGSSSADEAGIAGNIAVSIVPDAITKATIEQGAQINNVKNAKVDASKDDNWYDVIFSFANSRGSVSFGASTSFIFDTVSSYILGNVTALEDVIVNAVYDKAFLNVSINMGIAKSPEAANQGNNANNVAPANQQNDDSALLPGLLEEAMNEQGANVNNLNDSFGDAQDIINQINEIGNGNVGQPDRKTYSYAGGILLNVVKDSVQAYIGDGATVKAGKDVKVNAKSIDQNIEVGTILSFNGNSGGGGTVGFNLNMNDIDAYIGAATVDAKKDLEVKANEENILYSFSAGIGQAKDSSGVGTLSLDIQKNDIDASIRDGAKINTSEGYDVTNQSVKVNADFDNYLVKGVGAVSIKAGGSEEGSAKGAAIDVDAAATNVNAYIKGAEINASKAIDVTAKSTTKLLDITAAGAVSTNGGAYDGSVGLYVSTGTTGAYMENTQVNTSLYNVNNQQVERVNKGADVKVSAENKYDSTTVTGAIAGGTQNSVGGSIRVDVISDTINSYIKNSYVHTTGKSDLVNKSTLDSIAVTAAGSLSTSANAFGGAIMLIVDDTTQNSYISGSTVNAGSVGFDSDAVLNTTAVTGGFSISTSGNAIGGSIYTAVLANEINTYVLNSDVTATNDISLATDFNTDALSVVISGSGGSGVAASGAINTVVNNSHSNTYIKSTADKKVESTTGKVSVKGTDDLKYKAIVGNVNISISDIAAGGSVNTVVDNSNLYAGIEGTKVTSKTGVETDAHATNDIMSITVGGSGGSGVAAEGSINTVVMAGDVTAKITDSVVNTEGGVTVDAYDKTTIKGGTGAVSVSVSTGAIGASIVTGVINNEVISAIENSKVNASGDVIVSALANESIGTETVPFITVAGGGSAGTSLEGVIDTMVINSTSDAHIRGTKTINNTQYGVTTTGDVKVSSEGNVVLHSVGGAAGGGGVGGIGATVHTIVIDKDTLSQSSDTIIDAKNISSLAKEEDDFFTTVISAGGGGSAGIAGVVNTNVITSDVKTGFKNSTLTATEKIDIKSETTANMQTITGSAAGGGAAGFGLSAVNDVIRYRLEASADNVTATFNELSVDAQTNNTYKFSTVSGAGGGSVGATGVENVNYINNEVKAFATGTLTGDKATVNAKDKVTFKDSYSGVIAGGGVAGIGATVEVNEITSTILAYIGGNQVNVNDIDVKAKGEQTFNHIIVAGFAGGGTVAGAGTALANVIETTVKAYVTDNTTIGTTDNKTNNVSLEATNTIDLTEDIGAIAFGGGGGVGATVAVNKAKNTVEAYTGKNVNVNSKDVTISARSDNNFGNADTGGSLLAVAGAGGLYFGGAGTVMYNGIEDTVNAYVGKSNTVNLANNGKLDIKATDITKIYDGTGAVAGGAGGLGASVDYNVIENTVVACIKSDSEVSGSADISIVADSQETLNNSAYVVAGGVGALSGAVLYSSIGKKLGNASFNNFEDAKDRENFQAGENQSKNVTDTANEKTSGANNSFNKAYNELVDKVTANNNTQDSRVRNTAKKQSTDSLFTKSEHSGVTETDTDRTGTTSAYIDSNVKINANNLTVNAKNSDNVKLQTLGVAVGVVGVGVSIAVSDNDTTTNAFIQNDADIEVNSLTLKSESTDKQNIQTIAAVGGIVGGSGSSAHINSNKTTNTYINKNAKINSTGNVLITAISRAIDMDTNAYAGAIGGVAVGVSVAHTTDEGKTKIDIGEDVTLTSENGNITVKTDADESVHSNAWAAVGGVAGGTGAESFATVGKDTMVSIGKNFTASAENGNLDITSNAKNYAFAESNGRAYGGISAGGTKTRAKVTHTSGVKINDADESKTIKAKVVSVLSKADNTTKATTYAGAGAAVGIAGSGVYSEITSNNNVYVGKNYNIETGKYSSVADSVNEYVSYNKSNAFGVVSFAIPFIENTIISTVNNESNANINSDSLIMLKAANEVKKAGVNGYDLYGGSGGLATGSGGYIKDNVTLTTKAKFGGDNAYAMGNSGSGSIDVSAYNIANINEKADLYSHGGIAGADMDSKIYLSADADVNVSNKNIKTKDDHISYAARNDVDIYAKSNVESYGGVAGAGGEASAIASAISANVTFEKDTHSLSGRDTNISAVSNKSLESYIYARTRGLVSALNDESNAKSQNSRAFVHINGNGDNNEEVGNAVIEAFDSINITAQNTASKIKADRDSKAYQLWCIPYTGKGNKNTQNTVSGSIEHNGILKSGLGYNKSLHLNVNGEQVDENGNVVENGTYGIYANKEEIGTIKTSDMQEDIQAYERSKQNVIDAFTTYETQVNEEIAGYQEIITNNTNEKSRLEGENSNLTTQISTATNSRQAAQTALNNITNANNDITSNLESDDSTKVQAYIDAYGSLGDAKLNALISAREAYNAAVSEHADEAVVNEALAAYNNAKYVWSVHYDSESLTLGDNIQAYTSDITTWNGEIASNNTKIGDCVTAINTNTTNIATAEADLEQKRTQNAADIAKYDAKIAEIQAKINEGQEIPVYAIYVDDVVIRSGKITFNGDSPYVTHVSGNGYVHAPGQNASIKIQNDSVSNMAFNKLSIGSNIQGGVSAVNATIDNTIHFDTHSDEPSIIKVINTVDKNDPTISIDTESNAGDMVFYANIENPNGIVDITNYTGDVIVNSGVTAKDLHIKVPNGGYEQTYTNNTQKIGGSSGTGAILASGNITIESQTIDVNGLIKSGTEIKEVEIPDFTIKKVGDNYYQVVGTEESLLTESSTTKGYYYLKLPNDNSDLAVLRQIKAYFKPADKDATGDNIAGDIYLFKADTVGGNITLTGNIINTSGTGGKIELVNGYGHINVVNNSSHNLVTNSLNADTETRGVLTINDFKVNEDNSTFISIPGSYTIPVTPDYSDFENIKHENLTEEFLANHAGKYTAYVDDNHVIRTTAENVTEGNGSWADCPIGMNDNGHYILHTTYTPGSDAYYVSRAGEMVEYQRYVERSWIVELFCGEKYVTDYYYRAPKYGKAQNPIGVTFLGYDKPEINITSKGNVVMNNSISSLPGTINIQSDGNIISNSLSHSISGKNINLTAGTNGTIGEFDAAYSTVKPLQVVVYDDGLLTAYGKDVYLNYPKSGVSNIDISTSLGSNVYLATDSGSIDMKGKSLFGIQADNLELQADSININHSDMNEGSDYLINVINWIAKAKDDIYIENKSSIIAKYIVSDNNGNITLISNNGSILAGATDAYSDYNIHGGNYNIFALSGDVGESDNPLKFARAGIYNVHSNGDIYIDSNSKMYIDGISSNAGSVDLKAKFGIIASEITTDKLGNTFTYNDQGNPVYEDGTPVSADDMRVYHISTGSSVDSNGDTVYGNIRLVTTSGNIENLTVDTDGAISAFAGYENVAPGGTLNIDEVADATSDINITLLSKALPVKINKDDDSVDDVEQLTNRKDMKVDRIVAAQNVTLSSEGAVLRSNSGGGLIAGESITINAVGDVGGASIDTALSFGSKGEVSIYTKAGSDVLIYNYSNLKLNRIDVTNNVVTAADNANQYGNTTNSIRNVNIYSVGNITNAVVNKEIIDTVSQTAITGIDDETQETVTQNVDVNTQEISDAEQKYPNVRAENISLKTWANRIGDYNKEIVVETTSPYGGLSYDQAALLPDPETTKGVYIKGTGNTLYIKDGYSDNLSIMTMDTNIVASNIRAYSDAILYSVNGDITANDIMANSDSNNNTLTISSDGNVELTKAKASNVIVNSRESTVKGAITTDLLSVIATDHATLDGATVSYLNDNADKTKNIAKIDSYGDITLKNSTINGKASVIAEDNHNLSNVPNNIYIYDTTINDNSYIASISDTIISNLTVNGNFDSISDNLTVTGLLNITGDADIVSTKDVTINDATAYNLNINSENADITDMTIGNRATVTTSKDTKIADGTINGNFNNTSNNTIVTSKLTTTGNAVITSIENIILADADVGNNLNANAKNVTANELKVGGNVNSKVDNMNIKSTNDINIGKIEGNTSNYSNKVAIETTKSVKNGTGAANSGDTNITAKDINIKAGNDIGNRNNPINIELAKENKVELEAGNSVNTNTTGAPIDYKNLKGNEMNISSQDAIHIANAEGNTLNITTASANVELNADIKNGSIQTKDKRVYIDNESLDPDYYATAQIHSQAHPMYIGLDASNNIKTNPKYVSRHNRDVLINDKSYNSSMEIAITETSEANMKHLNDDNKLIESTDKSIYEIPTVSDYISNVVNGIDNANITDLNDVILNETNIMDVVNTIGLEIQTENYKIKKAS